MSRLRFAGWCILGSMASGTVHAQTSFNDFFLNRPGIISHWGMEETSGTTVADSITTDGLDGNNPGSFAAGQGASLNATGPRPADGFAGLSATNKAIDFAGTVGQRLDMNAAGYTGTDGLVSATLSSWFRLTSQATDAKHHHLGGLQLDAPDDTDTTPSRYGLALNSYPQTGTGGAATSSQRGGLRAFARVGNSPEDEATYGTSYGNGYWDSSWHFAATTLTPYGNNTRMLSIYVDGALTSRDIVADAVNSVVPQNTPTESLSSRSLLTFGQDDGARDRLWVGQLDGITTFDRDLSAAEIGIAYMAARGITVNHAVLPTRGLSAHRGASTMYPENTVLALKEAARSGAHQVEFDVQMTSDGKLVLMHDGTVNRTTDGAFSGAVKDLTLAEVKTLDAGTWKNATFAGEKVPTLEEALDALPLNMWLNVEIKGDGTNDAVIASATAAMLKEKGRLHQSFMSGSKAAADAVNTYAATNGVSIPTNNLDREGGDVAAYINYTINNGYDYIQLQSSATTFPTEQQIADLTAAGVTINYFFNETPAQYAGLFNNGVDFILTNDPVADMGGALDYGIVPLLALYRGDFTMNGTTDTSDFNLFFQALTDPVGFATANPEFDADIYGDFNVDGVLDVKDYQGFYDVVTDAPTIAGDYNLDGVVDTIDYTVWKTAFGLASASSLVPADGNGDGVVNLADYTVWRDNLGATASAPLSAVSTNVPEHSAVVMLGGLLGAAVLWNRRQTR
jgi:glycerophosphoryl diester phosphodiesterase